MTARRSASVLEEIREYWSSLVQRTAEEATAPKSPVVCPEWRTCRPLVRPVTSADAACAARPTVQAY
jgi:hypothetical protein